MYMRSRMYNPCNVGTNEQPWFLPPDEEPGLDPRCIARAGTAASLSVCSQLLVPSPKPNP